jgi:sterol-4alpha-carboxylate 3-dehydrogenase (decarboxylating)
MVINEKLFESVNIDGTRNLLSSIRKVGSVKALVFTSTSSVIHNNITDLLDADETLPVLQPPAQKRIYTLTKATAEEIVLAANRVDGDSSLLTCSLRPATAFGEADTICLGKMLAVAEQGKTRFQMGNGENMYDFMYVGNLVDAHILATRHLLSAHGKPPPPAERRVDGECFNVTNDERVLFWEFTRKIAAAAGHPVKKEEIVVIPAWVGLLIGWISEWVVWARSGGTKQPNMTVEGIRLSTIHRTLNMDKAKRVLGFQT